MVSHHSRYTVSAFASLGATSATSCVDLALLKEAEGSSKEGSVGSHKPIEWFTNRILCAITVQIPALPHPSKSGSLVEGRIQLPRLLYPSSDVGVWYSRERLKLAIFGRAVRQRGIYQVWRC